MVGNNAATGNAAAAASEAAAKSRPPTPSGAAAVSCLCVATCSYILSRAPTQVTSAATAANNFGPKDATDLGSKSVRLLVIQHAVQRRILRSMSWVKSWARGQLRRCAGRLVTAVGIRPQRSGAARCVRKKDSKQFAAGALKSKRSGQILRLQQQRFLCGPGSLGICRSRAST